MEIKSVLVGEMLNWMYLLGDKVQNEMAIVDPGWDYEKILAEVEKFGIKPKMILITHGHYDHITAVADVVKILNIPVYISKNEPPILRPKVSNLLELKDGDELKIGKYVIKCIHTPGHSPGGMCYLVDDNLFTGDTLFFDGCGRWDLPGADKDTLLDSIHNKIAPLSDDIMVWPGHNYYEKKSMRLGDVRKINKVLKGI